MKANKIMTLIVGSIVAFGALSAHASTRSGGKTKGAQTSARNVAFVSPHPSKSATCPLRSGASLFQSTNPVVAKVAPKQGTVVKGIN